MSGISRRMFFIHSAHTTVGVSAGWAAWQAEPLPMLAAEEAPPEKPAAKSPVVCLVSGSLEYHSDESLALFEKHLEKRYGAKCLRAFMRNEQDLPGLENLDRCDCMLLFTRRLALPAEQIERVKRFCRSGKAIVAIRTASHAFQNWLALDKEVLGGDYQNHYGNKDQPAIALVEAAKGHAVLAGVSPFVSSGSLYKNPKLAADATVLLTGTIPEHTEPVAWVRPYQGGRVFYTSLGHPDDFRQASFLRLLSNAIFWTVRGESAPKAPIDG
jgi:type 1 glutamine amidotransferase